MEEQEGLANQILLMIKKAIRDNFTSLKMIAVTYLFRLLENFASERNPYAPIVYKILTFSLIENHEDKALREYMLMNFTQIFQSFSTIPVGVLLEPLVKQIQVSEGTTYILNLFDFKLLDSLSNHPKLSVKQGILLLDVLAKSYLNNVSFAYLAGPPLLRIVERFVEEGAMQEYLIEFAKLALSKYYTSVKRKKTKDNFLKKFVPTDDKDDLFSGPSNITPEMEIEILNAQKRGLTINMMRDIINMNSSILNAKYKTLLAYTNSQIKQLTRHDNKGIKYLLSLFGDPDEIIRDYEEETNPAHEKKMIELNKMQQEDYINTQETQDSPKRQQDSKSEFRGSVAKLKGELRSAESLSTLDGRNGLFKNNHQKAVDSAGSGKKRIHSGKNYRYSNAETEEKKPAKDSWLGNMQDSREDISIVNVTKTPRRKDSDDSSSIVDNRRNRDRDEDASYRDRSDIKDNKAKAKEIDEHRKKDKVATDGQRFLRALEQLEGVKKKAKDKKMTVEMMEEYKKLKEEKMKENLKKQIAQRRMELGVQTKTNNYVLNDAEDLQGRPSAGIKKTKDLDTIGVVDLDDEEFFQKEAMTIYIKQNVKKFKYLFNKYCITGTSYKKEKSFDKLRVQYNTINQVAILRIVKENGLQNMVSKEELTQLLKMVNTKLLHNEDFQPLNFEGFIKFIVQLGIFAYTRPPQDQTHPLYMDCVKKLMFVIYLAAQSRGEHKQMLDEGNTGEVDRYELDALNRQVQEDPNMAIPSGFRRVIEDKVDFEYKLPKSLKAQMPQGYSVAYSIVSDLIQKQFGINIAESKAVFGTNLKIVPHIKQDVVIANRGRVKNDRERERELSENRGMSNDRDVRERKGDVSKREGSVADRGLGFAGKVFNKAMEEKLKKQEEEKKAKEELDKKRQKRKQELDELKKEMMNAKMEKENKREEDKRRDEMQKEEQEKLKMDQKKRDLDKKRQMLNQYKGQKEEEQKKKEEDEKEKKKKEMDARKEVTAIVKKKTENVMVSY